jgi:hypothetical protein
MSRFVAVAPGLALVLALGGCASAEDANAGGDRDLSASSSADDLAAGGDDLAHDAGTPAISCGSKHVVINEVQTGASSSLSDEFIELYNPCPTAIDLAGSSLVYRSAAGTADILILNLTPTIAAGGYLLITGPNFPDGGMPDQSYGAGHLAAAGGGVGIRDGAQLLVDSVGYGTATNAFIEGAKAPAPSTGQSIARKPNGADTDHNDVDFAVASVPTPRAAN